MKVIINSHVEIANSIKVSVYPVRNTSVAIKYKTLIDSWQYMYFNSIKEMQRYSPIYLEHCLITVTIN